MIFKRIIRDTKDYLGRAGDLGWFDAQKLLYSFASKEDLSAWQPFSDSQLGGLSTASLKLSDIEPGTAILSGNYSRTIPETANARLKRSGFAGINSIVEESDRYMDLDDYDALVFRVKGDGRKYLANIKTDNWVVGDDSHDVWQAFLFARKGEWQEVEIPIHRFLLTWKGKLVETRVEMNPARVMSVGISLAGGDELQKEGEYELGIDWIAARNIGMYENEVAKREEE